VDLSNLVGIVPYDGGTHRYVCPSCSPARRKQNLRDLSVTRSDDALKYTCHHCGETGVYVIKKMENKLNVVQTAPKLDLSEAHTAFLASRGISPETAAKAKLFASRRWFSRLNAEVDCIAFPYYSGGKLTACKYRSLTGKDFTQDAGGAHTFFGMDAFDENKPAIIVEGEIDALTLMEIGVPNALSVPSGAPMTVVDGKVSAKEDKRFSFVWEAFDMLSKAPYVVIATDNDSPGHALAEELARRIGKDRCRLAKLPEKDANEVFLKLGADALREAIDKAEPYPVRGISSAKDFEDRLNDLFTKGTGKGFSTGYDSVDQLYTVVPGQMTVVTGYPSMGKSNFVDQIMVNLARQHDWKFALCSFENAPEVHISRLIEIYAKRRFFAGENRISEEGFKLAYQWVNDHFVFLTNESSEPANIGSILERAKASVARMGVRGLLIDPYNYLELDRGESETAAISSMLTRVQQFAKNSGVHVWFVAHPAKVNRQGMDLPRPDGMAISGSMSWWAKTDCGVTVHRVKHDTQIAVWKCRYRWVGQTGETLLKYDRCTGTYSEKQDFF